MTLFWDAVVVGAGPGGASAAYHLASTGLQVALLDRYAFPRDKCCGDGITRSGVKLLDQMGVLDLLTAPLAIRGVEVHMGDTGSRDFPFPLERYPDSGALIVPRRILDHAICQRAVQAGAVLHENHRVREVITDDGRPVGVLALDRHGDTRVFRGRAIIAADGAASGLARRVGLRDKIGPEMGMAIRGYYEGLDHQGDRMAFYLLLFDDTGRVLLPSYGWVFPLSPSTANIGVGIFERRRDVNLRHLMARFVERLRLSDRRFLQMTPCSTWSAAPLRFDFDPERSAMGRMLLVGDAAGLVSPFTGEGISYALESGRIAADVIQRSLTFNEDASRCKDEYALRLAERFSGMFETGRHAGKRYRMIWKALRSTFHSERPLHRITRRLVLVPDAFDEGGRGEILQEVGPLLPHTLNLQRPLIEVARLMDGAVRRDWPFLARMSAGRIRPDSIPFRPSLLTVVCAHFGQPGAVGVPEVGAAVELGSLSVFAHASVEDQTDADANTFTLLIAEFLLAKSYALASRVGAEASRMFAVAISRAVRGRMVQLRRAFDRDALQGKGGLGPMRRINGTLGALPCRLGAHVAGVPEALAASLAEYGEHLALAYTLADECRLIEGQRDAAADMLLCDIGDGIWGYTIQTALASPTDAARELADLLQGPVIDPTAVVEAIAATGVIAAILRRARQESDLACRALAPLPAGAPLTALKRLAAYALDRHVPDGDPREMLAALA